MEHGDCTGKTTVLGQINESHCYVIIFILLTFTQLFLTINHMYTFIYQHYRYGIIFWTDYYYHIHIFD